MAAVGGSLDTLVLLLVGGGLALGLPHVTARTRRRFWHPWVNTGLLPLLIGIMIGPGSPLREAGAGGWLSVPTAHALQPFLAVTLAAAGVLLGTQMRPAYLAAAGRVFIGRETRRVALTFAAVAIPAWAMAWWLLQRHGLLSGMQESGTWAAVAVGGVAGAAAVATSQRLPRDADDHPHRHLVLGHVMPAGWWNLLACLSAAVALGIGDHPGQGGSGFLLAVALPAALGLLLGRVATAAPSRAEALLLLPAVVALAGGLALALGGAPLLTGMVVGSLLVLAGGGRAVLVERAMDELEQPVAVAAGLLAGLCLESSAMSGIAWLIVLVIPARWLLRSIAAIGSPTRDELAPLRLRRLAPAGATGVLLIAGASIAPEPLPQLVIPLTVAFAVGTLIGDLAERRP